MPIDRLDVAAFRIPTDAPESDGTFAWDSTTLVVVEVEAGGVRGCGYSYADLATATLVRDSLRDLVVGRDAMAVPAVWAALVAKVRNVGRRGIASMAISAVDNALWDLKARLLDLPLVTLLGAVRDRVAVYGSGGFTSYDTGRLESQLGGWVEAGIRRVKMKVGRARLAEDIERVRAMRAHLGAGFPLMVDANMRWSVDEAIRAARALREADPVWLEEPTIPDDVPGHARIVREGGLPIAAGENLHTLYEFRALIAAGGVTFPEPDVTNCGGITAFLKICHLAEAFNLPVTSHGAHDVTVHLLAAVSNRSYLEAHGFGLDRYIAEPLRIDGGAAVAPDRPGHGVEFDWKSLDRVRAT